MTTMVLDIRVFVEANSDERGIQEAIQRKLEMHEKIPGSFGVTTEGVQVTLKEFTILVDDEPE